jgi:hypothetical protein
MEFDVETDAGIVHHHVEPAEFRVAPFDGGDDVRLDGHITALEHSLAAPAHNFVNALAPLVFEAIDRNNGRTVLCQSFGDRTPQSTRRTRYNRRLAKKTHCSLSVQ